MPDREVDIVVVFSIIENETDSLLTYSYSGTAATVTGYKDKTDLDTPRQLVIPDIVFKDNINKTTEMRYGLLMLGRKAGNCA